MANLLSKNKTSVRTYKVGDTVPGSGNYICVPCGNKKFLKAGTHFKSCLMCLGKDRKLFRKGMELWEKVGSQI